MVVSIPNTVTIGGSISVLLSNGCVFSTPFTLIDKTIAGCQAGSGTVDDLFISQVTDSPTGSLTYVELYNATGATIDFSATNYMLKVYNNGNTTTPSNFIITINSGVVANNSTFVIAMGTSDSQCTGVTGADGSPNDLEITTIGVSINFFYKDSSNVTHLNRGHDFIGLYDASDTLIDAFGIFGDETWATGLGLGKSGANFERQTTASIPEPNFATTDWNIVNWNDCTEVDYSGIGNYDYSVGLPPMSSDLTVSSGCNTATITVVGTEGYTEPDDAYDLAYQWYYFDPNDATLPEWKPISTGGIYTLSAAGDVLSLSDISGVLDYQFYCQVRESGATCYQASNAIKIKPVTVTWNSPNWNWSDSTPQDTMPSNSSYVFLDDNYNTGIGGIQTSFEACNLIVNAGNTLTINNNTYVEVQNNLKVDGNIIVNPKGSFVQINDAALITGAVLSDKTKIAVEKETALMDNWYEYTYWSSPVSNATINEALADADVNRRFKFSAQDYRDSNQENANLNTFSPGQDDVDDDPNYFSDGTGSDWQLVSGGDPMIPGIGYASTHSSSLFNQFPCNNGPNCKFIYVFRGIFNNGFQTVPIYRNDEETNDNNWNLIGNPYPSAISADAFLNYNADILNAPNRLITGAIYLWSQNTLPSSTTGGNEGQNFSQSDYAIINGVGTTTSSPGGDGSDPSNRMIPSGQAFFIAMSDTAPGTTTDSNPSGDPGDIQTESVVFNNSMRVKGTNDNSQFFSPNLGDNLSLDNKETEVTGPNKFKINLSSENTFLGQILVGYVDGATNSDDGMYYDAPRNLSSGQFSTFYSLISESDNKFAIQGRAVESLSLEEIIRLGFYTSIAEATLYKFSIAQLEGNFMNQNDIFVKDNLLNKTHNLKTSDYSFTSEVGEFNDRFEIVFTETALSIGDVNIDKNTLQIIELQNGDVQFKVSSPYEMKSIEIIDLLGRTLYKLGAQGNSQTFSLSNLSQATYLAKVELTNGYVITKKALKRK